MPKKTPWDTQDSALPKSTMIVPSMKSITNEITMVHFRSAKSISIWRGQSLHLKCCRMCLNVT